MGTAPRSPTQEMNTISPAGKRSGARHNHTASGRATTISTSDTPSAGPSVGSSCEGVTSRPSSRNMPACDSQA